MTGDEEIETRRTLNRWNLKIRYIMYVQYININKRTRMYFVRLRNVHGQFNFIRHGFLMITSHRNVVTLIKCHLLSVHSTHTHTRNNVYLYVHVRMRYIITGVSTHPYTDNTPVIKVGILTFVLIKYMSSFLAWDCYRHQIQRYIACTGVRTIYIIILCTLYIRTYMVILCSV